MMAEPRRRTLGLDAHQRVVIARVMCSQTNCRHCDAMGYCLRLSRDWTDAVRVAEGTALEVRCHSYEQRE